MIPKLHGQPCVAGGYPAGFVTATCPSGCVTVLSHIFLNRGTAVTKPLYIAETDALGRIECVWVKRPEAKRSRVFDPIRHKFDPSEPADFHGSKRMAIMSWLAARQCKVVLDEAAETRD